MIFCHVYVCVVISSMVRICCFRALHRNVVQNVHFLDFRYSLYFVCRAVYVDLERTVTVE